MPKYLIDSNIFLEALLKQQNHSVAFSFLSALQPEQIFISKFSLYSIAMILAKKDCREEYINFVEKFIPDIKIVELDSSDLLKLMKETMPQTKLDFDDSYQYLCATKYDLELVSFDKDFDKTGLKRLDPTTSLSGT